MPRSRFTLLLLCLFVAGPSSAGLELSPTTRVVMLGSGTPNPDPERAGPAVAIVVNDTPYLVDFGPGVVRRAAAMSPSYGGSIEGLETDKLAIAFLTHLHSDHTTGLPDLVLTPWVMGRERPLELYGPGGVAAMAANILEATRRISVTASTGSSPRTRPAGT